MHTYTYTPAIHPYIIHACTNERPHTYTRMYTLTDMDVHIHAQTSFAHIWTQACTHAHALARTHTRMHTQ